MARPTATPSLPTSDARAAGVPTVTREQALDALEDLDDFARMTAGVNATGPRETLRQFINEHAPSAPKAAHKEAALDQALSERDSYYEKADALANAIADHLGIDIGEHSNANDPWHNALIGLREAASTGRPDYKALYEDAICASNEAGCVGMTAAETIRYLSSKRAQPSGYAVPAMDEGVNMPTKEQALDAVDTLEELSELRGTVTQACGRTLRQYIEQSSAHPEAQLYPLPDDLYDSKDWKAADYAGRVQWLHTMYEAVKQERDALLPQERPARSGNSCPQSGGACRRYCSIGECATLSRAERPAGEVAVLQRAYRSLDLLDPNDPVLDDLGNVIEAALSREAVHLVPMDKEDAVLVNQNLQDLKAGEQSTVQPTELRAAIMNLRGTPEKNWTWAERACYKIGHIEARHAAADLVAASTSPAPKEGQGEAVAWQYREYFNDGDPGWSLWRECSASEAHRMKDRQYTEVRPLYTHPSPRKPLTEEQIDAAYAAARNNGVHLTAYEAARAIEAAHGIRSLSSGEADKVEGQG